MEAWKLSSVEIRRKHVRGKFVSTFDDDTSSTLQKIGNVIKHHYFESFYNSHFNTAYKTIKEACRSVRKEVFWNSKL